MYHLILYAVFVFDTVLAIRNGFDWLYCVIAVLIGILAVLDIAIFIRDRKSKHNEENEKE